LFLHADCKLPAHYFDKLATAVNVPDGSCARRQWWRMLPARPVWGCFESLDTGLRSMAPVSWGVKLRTRCFSMPYGDQGLFCSRAHFFPVSLHCPQLVISFLRTCVCRHCTNVTVQTKPSLCRAMGHINEADAWPSGHRATRHACVSKKMAAPWNCQDHSAESINTARIRSGCICTDASSSLQQRQEPVREKCAAIMAHALGINKGPLVRMPR
jgi:hypothetical protein